MEKNKIALILGSVCVVLTITMCIQFKTINNANKTVSTTYSENKLRDEVLKWKENYDNVYKKVQNAEKVLESTRKKATENDTTSTQLEEKLSLANKLLGLTELTGKGITITLDDNKSQNSETLITGNIVDYIVHDGDLIQVVNDLKNAGAEAISINSQRIVTTSGIVCDGNVVRINDQKVSAPYVIKAIGYPEKLTGGLMILGGYMEQLQKAGVVKGIKKETSVTVPKYEGIISTEYLTIIEDE